MRKERTEGESRDARKELPPGYEEHLRIDLTEDRKQLQKIARNSLLITLLCVVLAAPPLYVRLYLAGDLLRMMPLRLSDVFTLYHFVLFALLLLVMQFVVILMHEGVHGMFFKGYAKDAMVIYGFAKGMAYAGCPGMYFSRRAYGNISLAPLLLLSIPAYILLYTCSLTRPWGYLAIYFCFLLNTSGAAGDIYLWRQGRALPEDSYILDTETGCVAYVRRGAAEESGALE